MYTKILTRKLVGYMLRGDRVRHDILTSGGPHFDKQIGTGL
jgi:hypothetical protein